MYAPKRAARSPQRYQTISAAELQGQAKPVVAGEFDFGRSVPSGAVPSRSRSVPRARVQAAGENAAASGALPVRQRTAVLVQTGAGRAVLPGFASGIDHLQDIADGHITPSVPLTGQFDPSAFSVSGSKTAVAARPRPGPASAAVSSEQAVAQAQHAEAERQKARKRVQDRKREEAQSLAKLQEERLKQKQARQLEL